MKTIHSNVTGKNLDDKKNNRAEIDILRRRLRFLDGKDKYLMIMYLENGCSVFQISQLTDQCEATIARKISRLKKRLLDEKYINCLRNREKFDKEQLKIAKDYFLTGLSIREITIKRSQSVYYVRETLIKIKSILNECGDTYIK